MAEPRLNSKYVPTPANHHGLIWTTKHPCVFTQISLQFDIEANQGLDNNTVNRTQCLTIANDV